jgi:ADP-heptose:LPS heptosyltransferase
LQQKPQHIAVIRLSAMGDVAMTVPIIRAFVIQYPTVNVTVVSRPFFKPFFDAIPNCTFFEVDLHNRHNGVLGIIRLFLDLKKLKIDAFLDLHNVLRSKFIRTLCFLSGIKIAFINKGRQEKQQLTRPKNKIFKPLKSVFDRQLEAFQKLGFTINISNPKFPDKAVLSAKILEITDQKRNWNWIGIAPFAQYDTKIYPIAKLQIVVDELVRNTNNKLFFFSAPNDEAAVLKLHFENTENAIIIARKLSFQEELNLISNLDVMLSMDSGNAHLAAMYGVNTITLWGATHPYAGFAPFGQPQENNLVSDRIKYPFLPTSVYGKKIVKGHENAMATIEEKAIIEAIYFNLKK